jgi:hypothetical protein
MEPPSKGGRVMVEFEPIEYKQPDWKSAGAVHDWKNYIFGELQHMWGDFTDEQKRAIAMNAQEIAEREEWD